jgi:hypothetical protein
MIDKPKGSGQYYMSDFNVVGITTDKYIYKGCVEIIECTHGQMTRLYSFAFTAQHNMTRDFVLLRAMEELKNRGVTVYGVKYITWDVALIEGLTS